VHGPFASPQDAVRYGMLLKKIRTRPALTVVGPFGLPFGKPGGMNAEVVVALKRPR
jgi:hypothetical protein